MSERRCPKCGDVLAEGYWIAGGRSYGSVHLAGGHLGFYWYCVRDSCHYFEKAPPPSDDETEST